MIKKRERDLDIAALILYFYYIKGKESRYCSSNSKKFKRERDQDIAALILYCN